MKLQAKGIIVATLGFWGVIVFLCFKRCELANGCECPTFSVYGVSDEHTPGL
jgi:hypothetical protein